ncbi:MAG: 3-oxoacyl-ACP reductase FabG [Bacillaceae bacterium]|nr:3-oxoacyl-ACP reductase FabG [Bacillaceae bacterium]
MRRLQERVAIITGGANGIGRETAYTFSKEGAQVVVADFDEEAGKELVAYLKEMNGEAMFVQVDVSDADSVNRMVDTVIQAYGRIDVLINNAGITRDAMLTCLSEEDWKKVLDVNLTGVFNCTKAVAPHMIEQGKGKIINTSSISGVYGNIGQTNYAASKAGVVGLTRTWAKELGQKGINVNAVAPGFIQTDMVADVPEKVIERMLEQIPIQRLGRPVDVAKAYLYLASDDADYVNGTVLHVDGGIMM